VAASNTDIELKTKTKANETPGREGEKEKLPIRVLARCSVY